MNYAKNKLGEEDICLLGSGAVSLGGWFSVFWRMTTPLKSSLVLQIKAH